MHVSKKLHPSNEKALLQISLFCLFRINLFSILNTVTNWRVQLGRQRTLLCAFGAVGSKRGSASLHVQATHLPSARDS